MKSIYEYQCDAALNDKRTATYWVEHYEAMPALTDGQRVALAAYRREADVCQQEYQRVKNKVTGQARTERGRVERKAVTR